MKFKILFTSKNNYDLLENWMINYSDYSLPEIINLDLGSQESQKEIGKKICDKYSIKYLVAEKTEFQHNLFQVFKTLNKDSYILYLHQDCFPTEKDTFLKIDNYLIKNDLSEFGLIGFNIYHDKEIKYFKESNLRPMTTSRCVLQKGNGYYMRYPKGSKVDYQNFIKTKTFAVENIMWTALLISSKSFFKNIKIDLDFNFFFAPDDMAYQFLSKNVFNIVFPDINFIHDQKIKTKYNLPKDSPLGDKKEVEKLYGKYIGVEKMWKKKWGFEYNLKKTTRILNNRFLKKILLILAPSVYSNLETIARSDFKKLGIKDGLLNNFFNHDPSKGPLKYFELKK
jgi:hypothetical protein